MADYSFTPDSGFVLTALTSPVVLGNDNQFPEDLPNPSFGAQRATGNRILRANFGDGYSQRAADGINSQTEVWDLTWNNLTHSKFRRLSNYLESRKGFRSFLWQSPTSDDQKPYICEGFTTQVTSYQVYTVSAQFIRVYDLL